MISPERSPLERNPECHTLLTAYQAGITQATDGWLDRLPEVPGLETQELSRLHGKLIALGMLDFQLSDRSGGIRYQLTPSGREILDGTVATDPDLEADEEDDAVSDEAQAA